MKVRPQKENEILSFSWKLFFFKVEYQKVSFILPDSAVGREGVHVQCLSYLLRVTPYLFAICLNFYMLESLFPTSFQTHRLGKKFRVTMNISSVQFSHWMNIRSDQISRSVVSDSLRPHESQHARLPCPSPTPGVHSDSCPSSQ